MKNNIRFILITFLLFASQHSNGQKEDFLQKETLVVLDDDASSEFNKNLKYAMDNFWNITKFKYISEADFLNNFKGKTNIYFIGRVCSRFTSSAEKGIITECYLKAFHYNKEKISDENPIGEQRFLAPSSDIILKRSDSKNGKQYYFFDYHPDKYDYVMFINYIQNYIKPSINGLEFASGESSTINNAFMHKKTLVMSVTEAGLYDADEEKSKKKYGGYNFRIVPDEEMKQIIDSKKKDFVYLRSQPMNTTDVDGKKVEYSKKDLRYIYVIDAETGFPLYELYMTGLNFKAKNLLFFKKE